MLKLGAHMSIAGGVDRAVPTAKQVGCEVLQIFTKSSNQWAARPLRDEEIATFLSNRKTFDIPIVAAHDSYLINLASPDDALWRKSIEAFGVEIERCETLQIQYLIAHPGAHVGSGETTGLRRIARALDEMLKARKNGSVTVLLEITAGQGSTLGCRFEHIAEILSLSKHPDRLGVCFDTCHAHAAGYEMRTPEAYERTMAEFDRLVGISRLKAFHLNDCKKDVGCRLDRHWHIGRGFLGLEPFRQLMNDERFDGVPAFLETPKGEDCAEDVVNLGVLRSLAGDETIRPIPTLMTDLPVQMRAARALSSGAGAGARRGRATPASRRKTTGAGRGSAKSSGRRAGRTRKKVK